VRVLVIDNGASNIQALVDALNLHEVTLVKLETFNVESANSYDVVVMSGSVHNPVVKQPEIYAKELQIIKEGNVPIIGICMGFEVIAYVFGAKFLHLKERILGNEKIAVNKNHDIFANITEFLAAENHIWTVQEVNEPLEVLATSASGIEVIKHVTKPIYGVQFHPESNKDGNESKFVLDNILNEIASQKGIK
jgi:GMP synthase (glutamine-hydrolysing)